MDGAKFEGEYRNGNKNGKGHFKWADGSTYEGDFVDNNIHGKGRTFLGSPEFNLMGLKETGTYKWLDNRTFEVSHFKEK